MNPNQQPPPQKFKSVEDHYFFEFSKAQINLLDQIEKYMVKHGKDDTLQFIRALKDSLK